MHVHVTHSLELLHEKGEMGAREIEDSYEEERGGSRK